MSLIQNKKGLVGFVCVGLLITASIFIQNLSGRIRNITVLGEGVQTCYQRIHQSYTARILGDMQAPYLEQSFLSSTQECLADSMSYFENHLSGFLTGGMGLLNEMNELTFEFTKKINTLKDTPENVVASVLGRRFSRVENKKDEFLGRLETLSGKAMASYSSLKWSFFLLIGLVSFLFIGELWNSINLSKKNSGLEMRAQDYLEDPEVGVNKVESLLTEALEVNGLDKCALLVNGTARLKKTMESSSHGVAEEPALRVVPVMGKNKSTVNNQINHLWETSLFDDSGVDAPNGVTKHVDDAAESISFNDTLANTLELLSSRLVTSAIALDTNVSSELRIFGNYEEVEQVLYHLINEGIKSCEKSNRDSQLSINTKKIGNTVFFTLFESGTGYTKEFLDFHRGLSLTCPEELKDLLIVKEFASALKADLSFENLLGSDGTVVGSKTQIAFRAPSSDERRLVSLKKGKKKDLEASFS